MIVMQRLLFLPQQHCLMPTAVKGINKLKVQGKAPSKSSERKNNKSDHTQYVMRRTNSKLLTKRVNFLLPIV